MNAKTISIYMLCLLFLVFGAYGYIQIIAHVVPANYQLWPEVFRPLALLVPGFIGASVIGLWVGVTCGKLLAGYEWFSCIALTLIMLGIIMILGGMPMVIFGYIDLLILASMVLWCMRIGQCL